MRWRWRGHHAGLNDRHHRRRSHHEHLLTDGALHLTACKTLLNRQEILAKGAVDLQIHD
jgi:hypothetical protein